MTSTHIESRLATGRRATGRMLIAVGIVLAVAGILATSIAWILVDGAVDSLDDSLGLTDEALTSVRDSIEVAGGAIEGTGGALGAVRDLVEELDEALTTTAEVLDEADIIVAETVPSGLDSVRAPLPALVDSVAVIGNILGGLSFVGIDYDPDPPPQEALSRMDAELETLANRLRSPETRLSRVSDRFRGIRRELIGVDDQIADLVTQVREAEALIQTYSVTADRATSIVSETRDDLARRRWLGRVVVVLVGALLVAGQAVPIIVGRRFLAEAHSLDGDSNDVSP